MAHLHDFFIVCVFECVKSHNFSYMGKCLYGFCLICTDNIIFFLVLQSGHKKSLVHGFISDDGVFEGKIHVGDDEYFVESAKEYFKDEPNDFHSVIYESRDVNYPHAYGPGCGVSEKTKKWMDKVKRYIYIVHLNRDIFITLGVWDINHTHLTH